MRTQCVNENTIKVLDSNPQTWIYYKENGECRRLTDLDVETRNRVLFPADPFGGSYSAFPMAIAGGRRRWYQRDIDLSGFARSGFVPVAEDSDRRLGLETLDVHVPPPQRRLSSVAATDCGQNCSYSCRTESLTKEQLSYCQSDCFLNCTRVDPGDSEDSQAGDMNQSEGEDSEQGTDGGLTSKQKSTLYDILKTLAHHHSRDQPFLRRIALAAKKMASGQNAPWKCTQCRQLVKRASAFCPRCQTHWQQTMDHTYIHGQKQAPHSTASQNLQPAHQQDWTVNSSAWQQQGWNRPRSKSRGQTPKGRRAKSANRQHQDGPGPPLTQYHPAPPQVPAGAQGKGAFLAPPPPPNVPWPGYGIAGQSMNPPMVFAPAQTQMMPQMMHMGPPPNVQQQHPQQPFTAPTAPVSMQHPAPPAVTSANTSVMDAETREFVELARARQSELPEDMRKKVQQLSKKEGAKATRNFHSAVRLQGLARSELEEALQARANLISSWRTFIAEAVKTWQDHTSLFQAQEIELQDRIQQAQKKFAEAKTIVEETKEEAGKVSTTIEVHDTDDEELMKDRESATNSTVKIKDSLIHLTSSLQQLHEQAMTIDSEEKASKRPRTSSPRIEDLDMDNKLNADSGLPASTSF
eukprot:s3452_g3.t1